MDAARLYELLWNFASHRVLTVAAKTGLLRALAEDTLSPEEAARQLQLDALACGKILRTLHALGAAEAVGSKYRLAAGLREHFLPGEGDLTAFVEHSHELANRWGATLEDWVRTGQQKRQPRSGEDLARFSQGMVAAAGLIAPQVVRALDGLKGVRRVLDLGGGTGGYARVFARANPAVTVTIVDIPEVAELGPQLLQGTDLEGRIQFQGGDYHQAPLGTGCYDLVLLANILHIESEDRAATLVGRAAAALRSGGTLAVVDFIIDEERRTDLLGCLFAINMRSFGDTHPEFRLRGWLAHAGATHLQRLDLPPAHWLIWGVKA